MKKINLLLLSASVFAALLLGGCKDNKSVDNPGPQIAFAGGVNEITLAKDSTSFVLSATITSTANLASVTVYQVTDSTGDVQIGKTYTSFELKTSFDFRFLLQNIVDAMLLKVVVTDANNVTATKAFNVKVTSSQVISANTKVLLYTASFAPVLGGQESGLPFAFSVSTGKVYSLKTQLANSDKIDFIYYVDATNGAASELISPKLSADNSTVFNLGTSGFPIINQTLLKIVPQVATITYGNAVGSNGTCIATTTGAIGWGAQTSGTSSILNSVYFNDINIGYAVGAAGTILKTYNSGTKWATAYFGTAPTTNDLNSVFFIGAEIGYAVGANGTILKTTNGGITWSPQSTGTSNLNSVYFTDVNKGIAVGTNGTILVTTDGGSSWNPVVSGTTQILNSVQFIDANNGYAVGNFGTILQTTDGGVTWSAQASGVVTHLRSVFFTDASNGNIVGDGGTILRTLTSTTNGVTTMNWVAKNSRVATNLRSVFFTDPNTGFVVGDYLSGAGNGNTLYTVDGGSTWTAYAVGNANLKSVRFLTTNRYITTALFDAITSTDDSKILAIVSPTPTTQVPNPVPYLLPSDLRVTGLAVNSIFAFKTAGGKYGLGKVTSISNSEVGSIIGATSGTITFDIKVQR